MKVKWHQEQGFAHNMPDDEWLEIVGKRGWVVVTQDRKFHMIEAEKMAVIQHKVKCFYLPSNGRWEALCSIIQKHKKMIELSVTLDAPFIFELKGRNRFYNIKLDD